MYAIDGGVWRPKWPEASVYKWYITFFFAVQVMESSEMEPAVRLGSSFFGFLVPGLDFFL